MNHSDSNSNHPGSRTEDLLRFSRRSMFAQLILISCLGALALGMAIWPDGSAARLVTGMPWMIPIGTVFLVTALRSSLRGQKWDPNSPEAKRIFSDELRRASMSRATRAAFIVVLVAQLPLALLLFHLPALRAVMAMAVSTITLGMLTVTALFLYFDRE